MKTVFPILLAFLLVSCSNSVGPSVEDEGTIQYAYNLPEESHVKIWVENSYQTTVKNLVDKFQPAGIHAQRIEMRDKNNNPLPEGLYTIYIDTDHYSMSRVLIYAKRN